MPFKYRENLKGWEFDKDFPISASGEIKKLHRYYFETQHQMFGTNKKLTFFYILSKHPRQKNFLLLDVPWDEELISTLLKKYEQMFFIVILLELITQKIA